VGGDQSESPGLGPLWIVDGNNVMGSRPDGWWRDRAGAAGRLAARIAAHAWPAGTEVVVVFDGAGPGGPGAAASGGPTVRYSGGARSADDAIVAYLAGATDRPVRVFTSDRGLAMRCRAAGADVVGAGAFLRQLESGRAEDGRN